MQEEQIMRICLEQPEMERILRRLLEVEADNKDNPHWLGSEWNDIPASPHLLNNLVVKGILAMPYKSRSSRHYKLTDWETTGRVLQRLKTQEAEQIQQIERTPPIDLFQDIVGYDDVKYWLRRILQVEGPAGCLLIGPPASAKTMFLEEIAERMGGQYYTGTGSTRKGIQRYIADMKPEILILDELDKCSDFDQSALLSVLESGLVAELKVGRTGRVKVDVKIFAAANYERDISPLLMSRFRPYVFRFRPYIEEEYIEIVRTIGPKRYGHTPEFCERVAKAMWQASKGDPRGAINALKVCKDESDLERLLTTVRRYSSG